MGGELCLQLKYHCKNTIADFDASCRPSSAPPGPSSTPPAAAACRRCSSLPPEMYTTSFSRLRFLTCRSRAWDSLEVVVGGPRVLHTAVSKAFLGSWSWCLVLRRPHLVCLRRVMLDYVPVCCTILDQPFHSDICWHILAQGIPPDTEQLARAREHEHAGVNNHIAISTNSAIIESLTSGAYNLLPLIITPPNIRKNLGGQLFVYYQFRRRHDYPLINDDFAFDLPPS